MKSFMVILHYMIGVWISCSHYVLCFMFLIKAVEQGKAMLRLGGLALCISIGECDVLLLLKEEMDEALVILQKESKGTCMS